MECNAAGEEELISLCKNTNEENPEFPMFTLLIRKNVWGSVWLPKLSNALKK